METLGNIFGAKKGKKGQNNYYCKKCDFLCDKKYSWDRHIMTSKHNKETFGSELETKEEKKGQKVTNILCNQCNKEFQTRSGLWKHSKICKTKDDKNNNEITEKELMMMIMKENSELKNIIMEVAKNGINNCNTNNSNNITTNSHNKAFNLNFFLNETCKDAMNIMDFVDSIKLQLSDLERVGEKGFVEGISNIIIKNLKDLDVSKRPVHCTDKKREVLYIKDEDKWEKEDTDNKKVRKAIKHIANKNTKMLNVFKERYPDCIKSTSQYCDKYNKLVLESFGGSGNEDIDNENKIIKKISQEVMIEKE